MSLLLLASGCSSSPTTPDAGFLGDAGAVDAGAVDAGPDAGSSDAGSRGNDAGRSRADAGWTPGANTTFYWDLTNAPPDNTKNVGAYDIDGWNNTTQEVATLHAMGKKVVCYMDVGTYEPNRPDSANFPTSLKGSGVQGWPGEFWLDVRPSGPNYATLQAIMLNRFTTCQAKGFDAVEPDNMDSYQNSPGFPTTATEQLAYDKWVAQTVHSLGLAVFQKNDLSQIPQLEPFFDGILDEECNYYSECSTLSPYLAASKPAWNAEYTSDGESTAQFCPADVDAGIVGALFALNLDGSVFQPCADDVGLVH